MVYTRENFNQLLAENANLKSEVNLLQEKVQCLMKKLFGRSSEKLSPDQLELELEELRELQEALELAEAKADLAEEEHVPSKRGKRKGLDARIPKDLPTEIIVIDPDEVLANPELYKKIAEVRTVKLDVTPTRFFQTVTIRNKYKKRDDRSVAPLIAPAPKQLIENSYASTGLVLHIILGKYCDHLPLYRQEQIFKQRFGVEISRKTMGGWMYLVAQWLSLIYEALRKEIRASEYIQADETFIKYQDPKKDYCPNGYLWAYHSPGKGVLFEWYASRAGTCLDSMLTDYAGLLQTDGYAGYTSWLNKKSHAKEKATIIHAACWAHARRKFAEVPGNPTAEDIVKRIAKLYRVERKLRNNPELDRAVYRGEHSAPVLEGIKSILETERFRQLPQSNFGKAINYTLERWDALNLYLEHGRLEIDNNLVENAIRPTAIGKKNFLFFGSPDSGQTSAVIYSLIETCRKLDINPADYLREVLTALPTMNQSEASSWTPSRWKSSRESTCE
ncbi:IS66 family transposase [Pontiellaceae bacterium B12227]|nr:IS66 family transposase [Pontiellaceae bacterium B12227]